VYIIVVCQNCGNITPEGKFCEHCGASLQIVPVQAPPYGYPQPVIQPQPLPAKQGMSALKKILLIGVILFCIFLILGVIGYLESPVPAPPPKPVTVIPTSKLTATPATTGTYSHTPSETINGYVDSKGSYRITTNIRDPSTALYSIRLVGPKNADLDLYVKKTTLPTTSDYDFRSAGSGSNEQISISYPAVGSYNILVHSTSGGGNFVLYIDYKYS